MNFDKTFFVHLFHVLFVGSLFLYVGINGNKIQSFFYPILFYLGIFVIIYHSYKAYGKIIIEKSAWVSYIHIFLVGPLLIIIGYNGAETSRKYFDLLLMAGMAAIGYHGYYMFF